MYSFLKVPVGKKKVKYVGFANTLFKKFLMSLNCISENTTQCYASLKKCGHRAIT